MKKLLPLIASISLEILFSGCDSMNGGEVPSEPAVGEVAKDSAKSSSEPIRRSFLPPKQWRISGLGVFYPDSLTLDSLHTSEGGDCEQTVYHFSKSNGEALGIDSTFCGEYGNTAIFYLFSDQGDLKAVYKKEIQVLPNSETYNYHYVVLEESYKFYHSNPTLMTKVDTFQVKPFSDSQKPFKLQTMGKSLRGVKGQLKDEFLIGWESN